MAENLQQFIDTLKAQLARARAEVARLRKLLAKSEREWETECKRLEAEVKKQEEARTLIEEANGEMAAALRELRDLLPEYTEETEEGVRLNIATTIDAALAGAQTGTAGKGWPEVVKKVTERLRTRSQAYHRKYHSELGWEKCNGGVCQADRAALEALEEECDG